MQRHDREVEPERDSPDGGSSPGADPDQDDYRKDSRTVTQADGTMTD
jgi:hypothetical protein